MAHPPEIRAKARAAYVHERLSPEAVAERLGVGVATVRRWKSADACMGDDWDKARAATALSQSGAGAIAQLVLLDFLTLHQSTVEDLRNTPDVPALDRAEALSRLADAFTKTMNAVAKASPDLGRFAVASELLQDLAVWVHENRPDQAPAVAELLEPFGSFIAKKYG